MSELGLDFELGEMADTIRDTTRRFAEDRIKPIAAKIDEEDWFPTELWPEMGALGLHGITVAEEDGGLGLGYLEHVVAQEEVARASASIGLSYGAHSNLCVNQIRRWASGGAEGEISAQIDLGRACREPRHVRGRGGIGRGLDEAQGRGGAGRLRPQRHQILDHQRAACRHARGLRQDRRGQAAGSPPS